MIVLLKKKHKVWFNWRHFGFAQSIRLFLIFSGVTWAAPAGYRLLSIYHLVPHLNIIMCLTFSWNSRRRCEHLQHGWSLISTKSIPNTFLSSFHVMLVSLLLLVLLLLLFGWFFCCCSLLHLAHLQSRITNQNALLSFPIYVGDALFFSYASYLVRALSTHLAGILVMMQSITMENAYNNMYVRKYKLINASDMRYAYCI